MLGKEVQPSGTGDLVVHPLGGILYLAGSDGQIRVLDYEMTVLQVLNDAHQKPISSLSVACTAAGVTYVATSSSDLRCKLFSHSPSLDLLRSPTNVSTIASSDPLLSQSTLTRYSSSCSSVYLSRDAQKVLTVGDSTSLRLLQTNDPSSNPQNISSSSSGVHANPTSSFLKSVCIDPSGHYLVSVSVAGVVTIYDVSNSFVSNILRTKALSSSLSLAAQTVKVAWNPTGTMLAIPGEKSVFLYASRDWDAPAVELPVASPAAIVGWHPHGNYLAALLITGEVIVWSIETQTVVLKARFATDSFDADGSAMTWAPEEDRLFVLRSDGRVVTIPFELAESKQAFSSPKKKQTTVTSTPLRPGSSKKRRLLDDESKTHDVPSYDKSSLLEMEPGSDGLGMDIDSDTDVKTDKYMNDDEDEDEDGGNLIYNGSTETKDLANQHNNSHRSHDLSVEDLHSNPEMIKTLFALLAQCGTEMRQKPFQSSSFPIESLGQASTSLLAYHSVGLVLSTIGPSSARQHRRISVAFFNPTLHCPPLPAPSSAQGPYVLAALSNTAIVLATAGARVQSSKSERKTVPAVVRLVPFSPWHEDVGMSVDLHPGECPVSLCLGSSSSTVVTSWRLLRNFSFCGIEQFTVSLPSDPINCVAFQDLVAVFMHGTSNPMSFDPNHPHSIETTPECWIFDMEKKSRVASFSVSLSVDAHLRWTGFSDTGILYTLDTKNVLRMYSSSSGSVWIPVLSIKHKIWPLSVQDTQFNCVKLPKGVQFPPIQDSHIFPTQIPFEMPQTTFSDDQDLANEYSTVLLSKHISKELVQCSSSKADPRATAKTDAQITKLVLKVVATNQPLALELACMIESPQILEKIIDHVNKKSKYPELVERLQLMLQVLKTQSISQPSLQSNSSDILSSTKQNTRPSIASDNVKGLGLVFSPAKSRLNAPQFD